MLNQHMRRVFFWVTVGVVSVVVVVGMVIVLRLLIRPRLAEEAPPLTISPAEATLCQRESVTFTTGLADGDVEWAATGGGEISADGRYVAGELPGDYEVQAAGPQGQLGRAVVHIVVCVPSPTPSPAPTLLPTATPTPEAPAIADADAQGDVGSYATGAPVDLPPAGIDIRNASVAPDLHLAMDPAALPAGLAGWAQEGEVVFWISLYDPIPSTMLARTEWLFILDLDGNPATGRPAGARPINPDLGYEVAVALSFDPADGSYSPYSLIWVSADQGWTAGPAVRHTLSEDRSLVALAISMDLLQQEVARVLGVTVVPEAALGRAAAIVYSGTEDAWSADLYPDRP
ncbi:MAG: hypothetical protein JW900_08820 [Anaerolineae bacterium]|nr:hypothetical protein [Anaerolineae bacterium]